MKRLFAIFSAALLCACGGSSGGNGNDGTDASICSPVGGGSSTVASSPAPLASFSSPEQVFDGSLDTFSSLNTPGGTGTSSIRGTLQPGIVQPAGSYPGVYFRGSISTNLKVTITTYLGGAEQERGPALSTVQRDDDVFNGRRVSAPYDAIEVTFNLAGDDNSLEIYELCLGDSNF